MKTKRFVVALLSFLMASGIAVAAVGAVWMPSLPSGTVTLGITNQTAWTFPWMVALTGVGSGFDVSDGTYTGWCVDTEHGIDRTQTYLVNLYSSYDPTLASMPATASVDWDLINYVLNNKDAGTADDIQAVLWYIVSGDWLTDAAWGYSHTTEADAILADAMANGVGYEPEEGDILAVICLPVGSEEERAQMIVIEITVPPDGEPPGGGKVTGGGQCVVGDHKEIPSASFGFNAMWFSRDAKPKGEINYVDHTTGQHVHVHLLDYLLVWEDLPGNKPHPMMKAKFWGTDVYSGKLVEVYVEDNGEPGKKDKFLIFLDGAYLGGSGDFYGSTQIDDTILAGNIQIHKPPK
jgi:hypothetical protein